MAATCDPGSVSIRSRPEGREKGRHRHANATSSDVSIRSRPEDREKARTMLGADRGIVAVSIRSRPEGREKVGAV